MALRDGSILSGFVTPQAAGEALNLGVVQPHVFLQDGTMFGFGSASEGVTTRHVRASTPRSGGNLHRSSRRVLLPRTTCEAARPCASPGPPGGGRGPGRGPRPPAPPSWPERGTSRRCPAELRPPQRHRAIPPPAALDAHAPQSLRAGVGADLRAGP